jgi:aspartate/methionine/tyrosine aminotransferase
MDTLADTPAQMQRLALPERAAVFGASQDEMDTELRQAGGPPRINLVHADTNAFPPPAGALEGFSAAVTGGAVTCPPARGDAEVRAEVAQRLGRRSGRRFDPDREVILTPGTQGALFAALSATVQPDRPAVLFDPEYFGTERVIRFLGGDTVHVPIRWRDEEPTPDLDRLADALRTEPAAMVFSNPNNPTGIVYSRAMLERIAELVLSLSPRTVVIADQLYARLVYDGGEFHDMGGLPGMDERCISLFGPSKTESMTGFRVGVAVGPGALIDRMERLISVMSLRAPAYSQHALRPWLTDDQPLIAERVTRFQALRDLTVDQLEASPRFEVRRPQGTAYVFPLLVDAPVSEQEFAVTLKRKTGILVNPGHQFGPGGRAHFRMCFAQDPDRWSDVLGRIIATAEAL